MSSDRLSVIPLISRQIRSTFFLDGLVPMYNFPVFGE